MQVPEPYVPDIGIARLVKRASAGFYARLRGWLLSPDPVKAIRDNWSEVAAVLPELAAEKGCKQDPKSHRYDVLGHSLLAVSLAPKDEITRVAALFHDIGKPATLKVVDGVNKFPDHAHAGAPIAARVLRRIGAPEEVVEAVPRLVREHFIVYKDHQLDRKAKEVARRVGLGVSVDRLEQLAQADIEAHRKSCPWLGEDREMLDNLTDRMRRLALEKAAAEYAPGLPEKGRISPLPSILRPREFDFAVQRHDAARAGCFAARTMISMADGSLRPIELVNVGDVVVTRKGVAKVSRVWDNGPGDEWVEVLHGQSRITCTPQHRFWVSGRGWVPAEELDSLPYQENSAATDEGVPDLRIRVFAEVPTNTDVRAHLRHAPGAQDSRQQAGSPSTKEGAHSELGTSEALRDMPALVQGSLGEGGDVQSVVRNAPWLDQKWTKEERADGGAEGATRLGGGSPPCRSPGQPVSPTSGPRMAGPEIHGGGSERGRGGFLGRLHPHACAHGPAQAWHSGAEGTQPTFEVENSWSQELELEGRGVQREADWGYWVCPAMEIAEGGCAGEAREALRVVRRGVPPYPPHDAVPVLAGSFGGESLGAVPKVPRQSGPPLQGNGRKVLHIRRLSRIGRRRYDLEVEGQGCYVAGGFLVHNSHFDLRLGNPETGVAHSWATKKMPRPGEGTYAAQQPDHTLPYLGFEGKIEKGYGAGDVGLVRHERTEVVRSSPKEIRFNLYGGRVPEQLSLLRQGGEGNRMWVLRNLTPSRSTARWGRLVPSDKPRLPTVPFERLDAAVPGEMWQPKVDGAHGVLVLEGGKPARLFSYRVAKNETGLVEHTHKLPRFWANVAPEGLKPTVLRVEITGRDRQGKPIAASDLGGILNASVPASREKQKAMGARLNLYGLGVERADGRLVRRMPHEEQMGLIRQLSRDIPLLRPMPTARTEEQKRRLQAEVRSGEHSLTREGVMVIRPGEDAVYKSPRVETHDVYVRRILPGLREGEAGGFEFSWSEHGPVAGVTGTGFSRMQRRDMLANPDDWVGRAAKVRAKERFPSGALRSPVFHEMHLEKGRQPSVE